MKVLTREEFRNHLRKRQLAPVYVLFGAETYLRDLAAKTIADFAFAEGDFRDFNENEYSLNVEGSIRSALAAAEQLPMMAQRRVVRICDVRVSATAIKDTLREEDEPALASYLARPCPSSIVIFVADELNGVRKIGKLLRENSIAVEFTPLLDEDLFEWARARFADAGAAVGPRALRLLVSLVGANVRRLTTEIEKLVTAAMPHKNVSEELINELVPNTRELDNFQLADQLLAGESRNALRSMKKILDDGGEPVMLLGLLSYNFRRLLMAKDMMERGAPRPEVAKILKLRYNDQEAFLAAARRTESRKLATVIERLAKTDLAIKTSVAGSGAQGSRLQIEMLICELAAIR